MRIPIGIRLGIGVVLVQLLLVAGMTWDSRQVAYTALEQQHNLRIAELSALLNDALSPMMVQRNYAGLQDVLDNVGWADGLEYLLLYDVREQLVARYPNMSNEALQSLRDTADKRYVLEARVPIHLYGQEYGQLTLGISTRVFEDTRQHLMQRGWRNALLGLLLMTLVIVPISLCLSRRLARLGEAAQSIANGELSRRIDDRGQDELGRIADAFNHMAASLEQRIAELDHSNVEKQQVIEALGRSNRDLIRLAEVSAHHMREPLRRLITYSQRLYQQCVNLPDSEPITDSITILEQQARKMAALVRDVESYLSSGLPQATMQWVDPSAIIAARVKALCANHQIPESTVVFGVLPSIYLDRPRLGLLFEVLLDNAIRYRHPEPEMALRVEIEGEVLTDGVRYKISDNGPGIAPAYRERLFNIFERLETGGQGTGAGLAIAQHIVESVRGRIWLESNDLGGTTVMFEFPHKHGVDDVEASHVNVSTD